MQRKKTILQIVKLIVAVLLGYVIYQQVFNRHDGVTLWEEFKTSLSSSHILFLILAIALVPLNWFLESFRWRFMINKYYKLNQKQSLAGVFMGITLGIISPQRIGEHAGRMMIVPPSKNWLSLKTSVYTSLAMNVVIIAFGLLGYLYVANDNQLIIQADRTTIVVFSSICLILLLLLYLFFERIIQIPFISSLTKRIKSWGGFEQYKYDPATLSKLLFITQFRYYVFVLQYVLLLYFLGIDLEWRTNFALVVVIYLIQSLLPLPGLISLLARGEIAILIFEGYNVNEISILTCTFGLWIINLMFPALIGMVLLWKTEILETLGIGNKA